MDKFVKQAFADAQGQVREDEFKAWTKLMENSEIHHIAVATYVGLGKVNDLCGAAIKAGMGDTLAEYAHFLMLTGFHLGYQAGMMDGR